MPNFLRQLLLPAFLVMLCATATPAAAQRIVVMVNGDPITSYDVTQLQRLHRLIENKSISDKQALEDLIDERIKIQQAKRMGMDVDQEDVDRMYNSVAQRSGRTAAQLTAGFAQAGLDARTFKNKLKADYIWGQYVRSRSGAVNIRDSDIAAALERRGATQLVATEYTLVPIVFVVPRNSNKYAARLSEAKALRSRFTDCESGLATVKSMREVVIRPQVLRLSSDMPPKISKIFDDTPVGHLTPPEVSQSGVETFAVCNKTQVRGESSEKREIKDELTSSQFEAESKKLLAELRKSSLIQYR